MYFSCTMCGSRGFLFAMNRIFATSTYWLIVWAFFMSKHHWKCLSRSLLFPSLSSFEGSEFGNVIYFDWICYLYRMKLLFVPIAAFICLYVLISMPNGFSVEFRFVLRMNDFIQKFNFLVVWVPSIHFYIFFWSRNFKGLNFFMRILTENCLEHIISSSNVDSFSSQPFVDSLRFKRFENG